MLKRWWVLLSLLLLTASAAFAQVPDPRDSVILESKTVAPGLSGHPVAFTMKVYLTNKDTIAFLTLALRESTTVGAAYADLDSIGPAGNQEDDGWTMFDCLINLKNTLSHAAEDFKQYDGTSPDRFLVAGRFSPTVSNPTRRSEPPNTVRSAFWELQFMSTDNALGDVQFDTISFTYPPYFVGTGFTIIRNRGSFVQDIPVNFLPGVIRVRDDIPVVDCPTAPFSIVFGRPFSHDFNADRTGSWSVASGPGSINPASGVYNFTGGCPLGPTPVTVRITGPQGTPGDCQFSINVSDRAPSCSPAQDLVVVFHGQTANNQILPTDPDPGEEFVFSKLSGPGNVNAYGGWSYSTGCADVAASPQTVRIQTYDAFGDCIPGHFADTCEFQLLVTNPPPRFTNCPVEVLPVDPGTAFSLQLTAADYVPADTGNLIFNLGSGPAGFSVSPSGLIQWTPSASQGGLQSATVQVRDLCGGNANCQLNFAVSVKGDMNGDLELRPADLVLHLNCVMLGIPPPVGQSNCDLNCDGEATAADVVLMINAVYRRVTFPFPC